MRGVETRYHRGKFGAQAFESCQIALDHAREVLDLRLRLGEIGGLALAQFTRVRDALLDARHFRPGAVETRLSFAERLGLGRLIDADLLDLRLGLPKVRQHRLHGRFAVLHGRIANPRFRVQTLQAQCQQFRLQLPLFLLERLIAAGRGRLALQMADLLVDLVAQIVEAIQILARLTDAIFGFPPAFLVARYSGRLLQERPQIVGPGLDDPRDHALLDDGVAARTQTRSEEQLGDVLAAHLRAIDEIIRRSIAAHRPPQRHFVIARVGAADLALGVVEHQFHRRRAQGLACCGTVEDDIGHRIAPQMLRGDLAHHPAHGINDVRLAASVRTDDAREAARKRDRRRVDE